MGMGLHYAGWGAGWTGRKKEARRTSESPPNGGELTDIGGDLDARAFISLSLCLGERLGAKSQYMLAGTLPPSSPHKRLIALADERAFEPPIRRCQRLRMLCLAAPSGS